MRRFGTSIAILTLALPAHAPAQGAFEELRHATLEGWAEDVWLQILDRNGAFGGRLSDRGILERFHQRVDDKYFLDRLSASFSLWEDYRWYGRDNGVRWGVASITKRDLIMDSEMKVLVPVGASWSIGVRFNKVDLPVANRSPVRLSIHRQFSSTTTGFVRGHVDPRKPGTDFETGIDWRHPGGARLNVTAAVLDPMNDLVFLNFDAQRQVDVDSTLEYERQPIAIRATTSLPVSKTVRMEGFVAWMRPATILAYEGRDRAAGLRQRERFAYAGTLLEWTMGPNVSAGAFASTVWARSVRTPLSPTAPVVSYRLTEQTTAVGVFGLVHPGPRWRLEGWLRHTWRPERREFLLGEANDVDFLLAAFNADVLLTYRAASGFLLAGGFAWNGARNPRGEGQVPASGTLGGIQYRFRYDVGWRGSERFAVRVGSATDFDGEGDGMSFGGARGQFTLFW